MLVGSGADLATVSRLLSHSDLSTIAGVYSHLTLSMSKRAADRVDELLTRRTG